MLDIILLYIQEFGRTKFLSQYVHCLMERTSKTLLMKCTKSGHVVEKWRALCNPLYCLLPTSARNLVT